MANGATTNGSKIYIGTTAAASNLSTFQADTYTEIGGVVDLGELGDEAAEVTSERVAEGRVRKFKGNKNAGNLSLVVDYIDNDAGQSALDVALGTNFNYNFQIELDDAEAADASGSLRYFKAKVMSARESYGTANNMIRVTYTLGVDSEIVKADAA